MPSFENFANYSVSADRAAYVDNVVTNGNTQSVQVDDLGTDAPPPYNFTSVTINSTGPNGEVDVTFQGGFFGGQTVPGNQTGFETDQSVTFVATIGGQTFDLMIGTVPLVDEQSYTLASDNSLGEFPGNDVPCFVTGTLLRTARGDVAVEALRVGDVAVTASGELRPVVWIGHRVVDCSADATPSSRWPVRVLAGAFGTDADGEAVPARDLFLSPGHPVLVGGDDQGRGGHLVPVMCLVNGTSLERAPRTEVTYWHVELEERDLLLAEGLAAESFLDIGFRGWFGGGVAHALADADFAAPGGAGRCRPVAVDGPVVERERRRLDALFYARLARECHWPGLQNAAAAAARC